jgi:4-amino-4-deoxy-L-arabinose transferase-like glycosyltransferase
MTMKAITQPSRRITLSLAGVLLLLLAFQLVLSVTQESQTADEANFIFSGYNYWKNADYGMNPETPPLIKLLAAVPLLPIPLHQPEHGNRRFKFEPYVEGRDFLHENGGDRILFRSRLVIIILSVVLAVLVFATANEMFGPVPAIVALALVVFEPNILAHGGLVTFDVGLSCFLLATVFAFYRYVANPSVRTLAITGVALGLALASKHTGLFIAPILMLLALSELVPSTGFLPNASEPNRALRLLLAALVGCVVSFATLWLLCGFLVGVSAGSMLAAQYTWMIVLPILGFKALSGILPSSPTSDVLRKQRIRRAMGLVFALLAIGFIAVIVLWSTYEFRYAAHPSGMQMNPPLAEFQKELSHPSEEHLISTLARFHVLPEAYLYGLVDVRTVTGYYPSYLFGKVYLQGRWFYFPVAFSIKSTAAFLIMIVLCGFAVGFCQFDARREILFLTIPTVFYFVIATSSGLNIGIRHILPVYPLLSILAAGGAAALIRHNRRWLYVVAILLAWHAASSLHSFPTYLSYANELWGGPSHTYRYLTDSNVDWGQQLKSVARFLEQNGIKNCYFAYSIGTLVDLNDYGIPCKPLPTRESQWLRSPIEVPPSIDGPVLISASVLSGSKFGPGELNPYVQFQHLNSTAVIDYGVFVFEGHYEIALASALNRANRAHHSMEERRLDEALGEAQQAVGIAPNSIQAQLALGDVLKTLNRPKDAQAAYQKALVLAEALGPENQEWITAIKNAVEP